MGNVDQGRTITLAFTDRDGAPKDPTDVEVRVKRPDGTIDGPKTFSGGDVLKDALGVFSYSFVPDQWGRFGYHGKGTGAVKASIDGSFYVEEPRA